jgi:hypothetical protein
VSMLSCIRNRKRNIKVVGKFSLIVGFVLIFLMEIVAQRKMD